MPPIDIKHLIDQYIELSFSVNKSGESLVRDQMNDDMTSDQHYTLRYIYQSKSCTPSDLAKKFQVKKSAITAMINRMWKKGWIQRTRDEKDRRVVYLTLTEEGKALYMKTEERIHHLVDSILNNFEQEELEQFLRTYQKLHRVLEDINKHK
ncbi:DNA-binding MarR family transcriptional regulator [Croceifilum oryzae]|uniref:DNA-binding MarR family transcriptional regulator n=1 Tax=Croceifilum oryzae TaxID=1553429 RepID=A0AAJ1TG86_9BACL|nr:MarR family transcriptional regulator [Croceifilum oryzae]MDQ0415982.1 DNA-binding MarR family transcriptional regulator [Croceifilum oryzae]